jgi:hypothetical protein
MPENKQEPRKPLAVCVAFLHCPTLAKNATTYLVLSQNLIQKSIEFSIVDFDNICSEFINEKITSCEPVNDEEFCEIAKECCEIATKYSVKEWEEYTAPIEKNLKWFIITETAFEGGFYVGANSDIPDLLALSLAQWKSKMAPPSILEFILRESQAGVLGFLSDYSHFQTKGCIGDFCENLEDARNHVLVGNICERCGKEMEKIYGPEFLCDLKKLLTTSWIGSMDDTTSVASILKKVYGYDLYMTKGLSPKLHERVKGVLISAGTTEIIKIIIWLIVGLLLVRLGIKIDK